MPVNHINIHNHRMQFMSVNHRVDAPAMLPEYAQNRMFQLQCMQHRHLTNVLVERCLQAVYDPLLRGTEFFQVVRDCNIKYYEANSMWPYLLQGEEGVTLFMEVLRMSEPKERLAKERDLFVAFLLDNALLHCRYVLHYLNFVAWDIYAGNALPNSKKGDPVVIDIDKIPCALAAILCETQEKASVLRLSRSVIEELSGGAIYYGWWKVETPGKVTKLELWELPWPTLGIPKSANDITDDKVWSYFGVVCDAMDLISTIAHELERWDRWSKRISRIADRISSTEEKVVLGEMVSKTHEILLSLALETAHF